MSRAVRHIVLVLTALAAAVAACAQSTDVTAQVVVHHPRAKVRPHLGNEEVVVWMTRLDGPPVPLVDPPRFKMSQRGKRFYPHVLALPVGAEVEFPNSDPFFHNVFSLYQGMRFDLGLYEAGRSRVIRFERPGVSFIFCNIHPEMSAYVVALHTPYYAVSNPAGQITIPQVPPGRYRLQVWYERADSVQLAALARDVILPSTGPSLGVIHVTESEHAAFAHTDKHGLPYDPVRSPY